jgi:hypothetical protein
MSLNPDLLVSSIEVLPDQVVKNVETIVSHQDRYRQNATADQRVLDKIAAVFGQPPFLYFQISFFTLWGIYSHLVDRQVLPTYFPLFDVRGMARSLLPLDFDWRPDLSESAGKIER